MKTRLFCGLTALMALAGSSLQAAPVSFKGYSFDAYVVKSNGARYREFKEGGRATLKVRADEEYSIVIRNPLPVRAAVAVSVDGLNSIDGQRSSPRLARKWMIEPNSSITIAGWQTGGKTLRKFLFTQQESSFAQWQEGKQGKPHTKNLGVIGVAWFWNSGELETALHPPQPFAEEGLTMSDSQGPSKKKSAAPEAASARSEGKAGTGMGEEQVHHVTTVQFDANAGMFLVRDVLKLFYEFAQEPEEPQPFVIEGDEDGRFAPDMHK